MSVAKFPRMLRVVKNHGTLRRRSQEVSWGKPRGGIIYAHNKSASIRLSVFIATIGIGTGHWGSTHAPRPAKESTPSHDCGSAAERADGRWCSDVVFTQTVLYDGLW